MFWKGNFNSSISFLFLSISLIDSAIFLTVSAFYTLFFNRSIGWLRPDSSVRVYSVSVRVSSGLRGGDGHDMGDRTDRRQPLHHRVSTIKSVSMVHPLEGEDAVGCRVNVSSFIQHPELCEKARRTPIQRTWQQLKMSGRSHSHTSTTVTTTYCQLSFCVV